ncbi:MAG: STAS domain-containing protein [Clostridia bacterium]|nr:STAS domain-containing protein [Clostridia bacterium]
MKVFQPKTFTLLKNYSGKQFVSDIIAGIIVAIIALPLSIALAMASGVSPERGIYTAIFAGFVIALLGGSNVNISGPTAAFATIVAGIYAQYDMSGLALATVMAGIILILMGICRFGALIKYIPLTITTGFTSGIALTIAIGQVKDFLGLSFGDAKPVETIEKAEAVIENIGTINVMSLLVGLFGLAILITWPKLGKVGKLVPGSLIAVLAGTALVKLCGLDVATIGDLHKIPTGLPAFSAPSFSLETCRELLPSAFTIAILAAIESLLSCVVSDGMIGDKHNSNTELIAQGAGNIASALFGGIPATGAIARTAANVKNGGRSPVAGMVHAVVLLLVLLVLMPYAAWIPMPIIAAILFVVAYNMCEWRQFVKICKMAPKSDILVLVVTFALTVIFDLVVAIEIGLLLTVILFLKRMTDVTSVRVWDKNGAKTYPDGTKIYDVDGPLFFSSAEKLSQICPDDTTKNIIIRMHDVQALDVSALKVLTSLVDGCKSRGVRVVFAHVQAQPMKILKKSGFFDKVGNENFADTVDDAILAVSKN